MLVNDNKYLNDHNSKSEYDVNDMFINNKLELVRIQTITKICTAKKQQYQMSKKHNNLVLKTNEGIDVSSFIDLSKTTEYSSNKLYFITSMFRIAQIRPAYHSYTEHLNNVNILYTGSASLNPSVKYEDALFDNNYEKIFDKTYSHAAYLKFKKLHDIIDEKLTGYGSATTSITSAQIIKGNIAPAFNGIRF